MSGKSSQVSTMHRQQLMLKALVANHGVVTRAAKAAGITPQTHYNWFREDMEYQDQVELIKFQCYEQFKDLVMDAVIKKIKQGTTAIIAMCYKSLFKDNPQRMESLTPFKQRLTAKIKYVSRIEESNAYQMQHQEEMEDENDPMG